MKSGADSNALNKWGSSVLHFAIMRYSHSTLGLILNWGGPDVILDNKGDPFLVFAARKADEISLRTLIRFVQNLAIDPDQKKEVVESALEVAKWRRDMNEDYGMKRRTNSTYWLHDDPKEWYSVFEELALKVLNLPDCKDEDWETTSGECTDGLEPEDEGDKSSENDEQWEDAQEG